MSHANELSSKTSLQLYKIFSQPEFKDKFDDKIDYEEWKRCQLKGVIVLK